MGLDDDLDHLDKPALIAELRRLRAAIREHRDASGHRLCWHHPAMWGLLPEKVDSSIAVPKWPDFLRGCIAYRTSLDEQAPSAPRIDTNYKGES